MFFNILMRTVVNSTNGVAPRKYLGAYYTDASIAEFLLRWAVVTGQETVLDPSFGGGVFLTEATERIRKLGGDPSNQVHGIEIDPGAYEEFAGKVETALSTERLVRGNFFEIRPGMVPPVDVVVGNPPFIRYQRFNGESRQTALRRAEEAGVRLSRLTSAWAPFLIHAVQFVKPSGRLAMVAPAELAHAAYARPVLGYLRRNFRSTQILSFSRKLFPKLSEDTVLVLAAGRSEPFEYFGLIDLTGPAALAEYGDPTTGLPNTIHVDASAVGQGQERLLHYLLPKQTRELYQQILASRNATRLGNLADVGIGYVTGDNEFFHVDDETVARLDLPAGFLRRAVRNGSQLSGLRFTLDDWRKLHDSGHRNLLLSIPDRKPLPEALRTYLEEGVKKGVAQRYKCRVREPWYRVPHVHDADGFLTYMSGSAPKLVANDAGAVAPNTLLLVRLYPLSTAASPSASTLAATWQTSLTAFSCELEGHSLGGGMLKLEPTEAGRVAIALPNTNLTDLAEDLDILVRQGKPEVARDRADDAILHEALGLSRADVQKLREGWRTLRSRRLQR